MAKPKLALIPAAQGSDLYSVLPSSGVGDFDFTRSGSATRINSQGLIESVGSGVSRLNYPMIDGVVKGCPHHILEPQRLQRIQYSEDFSNAAWTKSNTTITSNSIISPDGTLNASKLYRSSTGAYLQEDVSLSGEYSYSLFAKSGDLSFVRLLLRDSSNKNAYFNIENGTVGTTSSGVSASIDNLGNGWYRCSVVADVSFTGVRIYPIQTDNSTGGSNGYIHIYGAQLEQGSYPTSYIPNYGTALGVTRQAETANGSGDAATFNDSEGVLMAEISNIANDGTFKFISLSDGTLANVVWIYYRSDDNAINFRVLSSGASSFDQIYVAENSTNFNKLALKYKENDFSAWVNGFEVLTGASGLTFSSETLNTIEFSRSDDTNHFYGKTKQLQYFQTALTDSELEQLTSWTSFTDMAQGQLYTIE